MGGLVALLGGAHSFLGGHWHRGDVPFPLQVLFVESICDDPAIIEENIKVRRSFPFPYPKNACPHPQK